MEFKKRLTKKKKAHRASALKAAGRIRTMVRGKKRWLNPASEASEPTA